MSEFEAITTQEQFDQRIGERLKRERETISKKYEGYLSPEDVQKKYEGYLSPEEAAEKDKKIKGYETNSVKMRIAHEHNIPYELAERLTGETEEDLKKDAETMAKFLKAKSVPPLKSTEPGGTDGKRAAVAKMLSDLKED